MIVVVEGCEFVLVTNESRIAAGDDRTTDIMNGRRAQFRRAKGQAILSRTLVIFFKLCEIATGKYIQIYESYSYTLNSKDEFLIQ